MDLERSLPNPYTSPAFKATGTMMVARDAGTQRLAAKILVAQAVTTILIAALGAMLWGKIVALSALAGGFIGLIANALMMVLVLRAAPAAADALGRLVIGQMVKVLFTVGMLFTVARGGWASWPALLGAYAATLLVYWFVPVLTHRMRRAKS
jgi:F0F1-type ATP synthase assembly protein I